MGRKDKDHPGQPSGAPRPDEAESVQKPERERSRASDRSEDFGGRRDIETADQPVEEHDRKHHDRGDRGRSGGTDVETTQPV